MSYSLGPWKVRIERPVFAAEIHIWIYRHLSDGITEIHTGGELVRLADGNPYPKTPSLVVSCYDGKQLMQALAEALAEEGIKTPNDHRLQGILDAQTAHLQDMRTLLKLNNKSSGDK